MITKFWAHPEGHPHTEGTFTGTQVNVGDLGRTSGEYQGGCCEFGLVGSPNFARLLAKDQGATRLGATRPRASEGKICL